MTYDYSSIVNYFIDIPTERTGKFMGLFLVQPEFVSWVGSRPLLGELPTFIPIITKKSTENTLFTYFNSENPVKS
jgi:hypothetical protein